jgi:hypothetical protein
MSSTWFKCQGTDTLWYLATPNPNTAIELYYQNKVVPVDRGFKKYLQDSDVERLHANSYAGLFQGVKANYDYLADA